MRGDQDSEYEDSYMKGSKGKSSSINSKRSRLIANKQSIIAKLNESLINENSTPDDVQNILVREKAEKQRNE